jgi:aspartate kinase
VAILVQKYGGSSVADAEKIGQVADKVALAKRAGNDVVVVVSAMGKSTDALVQLAKTVAGTREPPRRELDMLVSTGERVTMALLSIALDCRGIPAISFTGSQSGIITSDRHFDARIIEVRPHRIEDELARDRVVIVAGYQGMSYRREITTLGRGGSDTTAVALAAALGASHCEIYSDVDGVYTADPRTVPEARHIAELDLATLAEMADCGAKVLNAQAVDWARRNKVAIVARRTQDAHVGDGPRGRETVATGESPTGTIAVVGQPQMVLLQTDAPAALLAAAKESQIELQDVTMDCRGTTAAISLLNYPDWAGAKARLQVHVPGLRIEEGLALVTVVMAGVSGLDVRRARVFEIAEGLGSLPARALMTPARVAMLVPETSSDELQRALHRELVEQVG